MRSIDSDKREEKSKINISITFAVYKIFAKVGLFFSDLVDSFFFVLVSYFTKSKKNPHILNDKLKEVQPTSIDIQANSNAEIILTSEEKLAEFRVMFEKFVKIHNENICKPAERGKKDTMISDRYNKFHINNFDEILEKFRILLESLSAKSVEFQDISNEFKEFEAKYEFLGGRGMLLEDMLEKAIKLFPESKSEFEKINNIKDKDRGLRILYIFANDKLLKLVEAREKFVKQSAYKIESILKGLEGSEKNMNQGSTRFL